MPYYAAPGSCATMSGSSGTYKSMVAVWCGLSPLHRIKVYEIMVGAISVPNAADCAIQCDLSRQTATGSAAGTTTTVFAQLDSAEGLPYATGMTALTTETTVSATVSLWNIGMNQRATVRWIAAQESQYMISPLTSGLGFALRSASAGFTTSFDGQISFME